MLSLEGAMLFCGVKEVLRHQHDGADGLAGFDVAVGLGGFR